MGILVIALSINPRPLSALELTLSGLIMGSRVDTADDNQNPHVIISKYNIQTLYIYHIFSCHILLNLHRNLNEFICYGFSVKCPTYQSFSNGNINMTVVGGRTEAMFTCDSGCSLNGQSTLTCQSDGTWDFQTPNCGES